VPLHVARDRVDGTIFSMCPQWRGTGEHCAPVASVGELDTALEHFRYSSTLFW